MENDSKYPVDVVIGYQENYSRLLALANILFMIPKSIMLIPHLIILVALSIVSTFVFFISQLAVLFTGRFPKGMFDFQVNVTRWTTRVNAYFMGLVDKYPPFSLDK